MGLFRSFLKSIKEDGPLIAGMLRAKYNHRTMTGDQKAAYDTIVKTVSEDKASNEIRCTVPAGISEKDARKALHVIQLEYGPGWKVVSSSGKDGSDKAPPPKP